MQKINLQNVRQQIGNFPRMIKQVVLVGFDFVALSAALWCSFALRLGAWNMPGNLDEVTIALTAPLIALPIFVRMGLYRAVIRYLPERAIWTMVQAVTIATLAWVALAFLAELIGHIPLPRSVPIIYWALSILLVGGSRFAAKKFLGASTPITTEHPILVYGAGEAGIQLVTALRQQSSQLVVGFIDDRLALQGRDVAGIRVYPPTYLKELIDKYGVGEVILSIPSLTSSRRREIVATLTEHNIKIRTLPNIADLVSGKYLVSQIREIDIDELLGRSSVPAEPDLLRTMIKDRAIMVTGAGGSIGSELCRLIAKWEPAKLVLFEANEFALYNIDRELGKLDGLSVIPILGTVADQPLVTNTLTKHAVQVVFHAAAHKHVPLVEANPFEGIKNNVLGTRIIADAALDNGVENFVLISTDKAVRPTNVMGATKRWAEIIIRQKSIAAEQKGQNQKFCAVRFGNVLGSNGSVVPLFKEQITDGGPVTLTDPKMTRYFMSIHEAAELIIQAGALSDGGDVFLLDMGQPVAITDLAENMIRLAGFTIRDETRPNGDIEIVVTGKRPGEKMYEELFYDADTAEGTAHPKIMRARKNGRRTDTVEQALENLQKALCARDEEQTRKILFDFIN